MKTVQTVYMSRSSLPHRANVLALGVRELTARCMATQTFAQWHSSKSSAKQKAAEQAAQDRKRKGVMTGREIFQQVPSMVAAVCMGLPYVQIRC